MSDSPPTDEPASRTRSGVSAVTHRIDSVAGHVERLSEGVVDKAVARFEERKWGGVAAALIRRLREGIVFMLRDWRLTLLQVPAAFTVSYILYRLRVRALGTQEIATMSEAGFAGWLVAGTLLMGLVYTCSTVFASAITLATPGQPVPLDHAWAETRKRGRLVAIAAVLTAVVVVGLFLLARHFGRRGYTVIGLAGVGILVLLITIVPIRIAAATPRVQRQRLNRERAAAIALGTSTSVILEAPSVGMGEVGRLFTGVPGLRIFGWLAVIVAGLLQMAASSSARAFKLTTKLGGHEDRAVSPPPPSAS